MNLVYTIINLIVLFLLLRHFLIKPVSDIMEKRRQMIADGLQGAQDAQSDAQKMKQEYEDALKGAKLESAAIVEKARSEAKTEYDRILYEVGVPKEAVQKTREIFEEVPQLHEIFANPTIELQKKMNVVDRVFPKEIRNFLKVACRYQRMNLIEDIFTAYDRYCDEQNQVLNAVLTCIQPPTEEQKKGMEAFLCKKYGAKSAKIEVRQDKALLGGFILRVGSDEYDWSMKGRLNRLEQRLTWR